jgi:hypothetical protein
MEKKTAPGYALGAVFFVKAFVTFFLEKFIP